MQVAPTDSEERQPMAHIDVSKLDITQTNLAVQELIEATEPLAPFDDSLLPA